MICVYRTGSCRVGSTIIAHTSMKIFQLKAFRIALLAIGALLLIMQFVQPTPNDTHDDKMHLATTLPLPDSVAQILKTSCYDCHSNQTNYPWYSSIQPAAWWLNEHINEGKHELNFAEFSSYRIFRQYRKLRQIDTTVQTDFMPLESYTWIHRDAVLSPAQKEVIHQWVNTLCDSLRARYPADSLRRPSSTERK